MHGNQDSTSLGPWSNADLVGTAAAFSGAGSDDDLAPIKRFGRNVGRLALRRIREHLGQMRRDAIAIFLLQPSAPTSSVREPLLGDGGVEVCGRIWFVSVTAQSGRAVDVSSVADGDMFEAVQRLGFGQVPAVVYNPKVATTTIRVYEKGLDHEDDFETIPINDRQVTIQDIRQIIDLVHEKNLCTPDAQVSGASLWADSAKLHAASNAEAIAQLQVKTALSLMLFSCDIRHEQRMRGGRVDLEVVQRQADGSTITPAEIEIKVLRERNRRGLKWSEAKTQNWIRRGVRQAAAYRDERGAVCGMLCCFDMREVDRGDDVTFATVKPYAEDLEIVLHRNFLYHHADGWRLAKYGC